MEDEPLHPIFAEPWTYKVVRVDWRPSPVIRDTYIDFTFEKKGTLRRLRFLSPRRVRVDEGYCGQGSGLEVRDIRSRGWEGIRVQVVNNDQDPGIEFFAADVVELDPDED